MTLNARVLAVFLVVAVSSLLLAPGRLHAEEKTGDEVKYKEYCVQNWNRCIRECQDEYGQKPAGLKGCLKACNDVWLGDDCKAAAAIIRNPGIVAPAAGGVLEPVSPTPRLHVVPRVPLGDPEFQSMD
jgi:hypothetical protein